MSLAVKLDVIQRLDRGERSKDVCAALNLASSTIHTIYKQKDKLLNMAETCFGGVKLTRVTKSRNSLMGKLESLLAHWIETHNQQNVPLSFSIIQEQALALFDDLKKEAEEEGTLNSKEAEFKASHGWFERFKNRVNLHNMRLAEDTYGDFETFSAKTFPQELLRIVEDGGYVSKQVFNIDEVSLCWKKLPSRTSIAKEEKVASGFKVSMERLTLLLGGNLDGDCKLKPLLVYYTDNPKALKGLNKASLPVIWRSNKKAWVQKEIFADYITGYLSPFLANYFAKNKVDNKALLVIDSAPAHHIDVEDYADNIRVVFLPKNCTAVLQPMDQGIVALFKAYYLQLVMLHLVSASDGEKKPTVKALWKDYNIKMAIENIATAWSKITQCNLNGVWKNLLPKYVCNFQGLVNEIKAVQQKIVKLAVEAGFYDVDQNDVQELLESHSEELSKEELLQLEAMKACEDEDDDDTADIPMKTLDIKTLTDFFTSLEKAMSIIEENDPNLERSSVCRRKLMDDVQCYKQLLETKKKAIVQTNVLSLFRHQKADKLKLSTSTIDASEILMEIDEKDNSLCSTYSSDENLPDSPNVEFKLSRQEIVALSAKDFSSNYGNCETASTHNSLLE